MKKIRIVKVDKESGKMCVSYLSPTMDFIFKQIFGSENEKTVLLSFLNAAINPKKPIMDVELRNVEITKEAIEDKSSRLDIKATTEDGVIINVEVQLTNKYNMPKRTLFYWSKLYSDQLKEGIDYKKLKKTICINILDFIQYPQTEKYHTIFKARDESGLILDENLEIHFLELPKLKKYTKEDRLSGWGMFLKEPASDMVEEAEENIKEIKTAKNKLYKISSDKDEQERFRLREKALLDEFSALTEATEKGAKEEKLKNAKSLLGIITDELIAEKIGLTLEEVGALRDI